jgi:tetratricopeptide (TPR) repeat protein
MLELQPLAETHADLHLALMQLYTELGDPGRAVSHADAALALIPRGDSRLGALANRERSHVLGAAREAARGGDPQLARSLYAQALATADDPGPRFDILMEWGIFERFQANPQRAIELLEQALLLQPDHGEAHANYGAVLLDAGRLDEAIREFAFVIGKNPDHYWAHYYTAVAYQRGSRLPEAVTAAERAAGLPVDAELRSQAIQLAVAAAIRMGDCAQLQRIAQRYQPLPLSQQEAVARMLAGCP